MEVLFLTEGGRKTGFGHLTRCLALAQGIEKYISKWDTKKHKQKQNKNDIEFIVSGDKLANNIFNGQNFKIKIKDWIKEYKELEKKLKKTDLIIIDSYLATKKIYEFIYKRLYIQKSKQTAHRLICIDDYNRILYPPCIIINGSIYGDKLDYPHCSSTYRPIYLLGKDYITLRKEFWKVPRKYIRKRLKDILITFGGGSHVNFTKKLLKFLTKSHSDLTYHVVSTSKEISFHKLFPDTHIYQYQNLSPLDMRDLMLKCDIAISAGGQTLYELARVGVPAIGICFAENQMKSLKGFHEEGFLENMEWYSDEKVLNRIDRDVRSLVSQKVRYKKNVIGNNLVDGKGVERILGSLKRDEILEYENNKITLRHADIKDCYDLWFWRNHPDVRRLSFEEEEIEYESHKKWFERRVRDKKTSIYIAKNLKREKVGQIRFEEKTNKLAYVNINLNPKFIGKGLGNKIIKIATKTFMKEKSNVKEIVAEIFAENVNSKKAFQKAGYMFSHDNLKDNMQIVVYKFSN